MNTLVWRVIKWAFVVVLVGMAIHTPATVLVESHWPDYELLAKSWKEIVLGGVLLLLVWQAWRVGKFGELLRDKFVVVVALIAALHVVLLLVFDNSYVSELAGLLIDLRYYLLFIELYVATRLMPSLRRPVLVAATVGCAVVIGFGVLQATILPKDILSPLGYSDATIKPYLTVDLNDKYIRINSTLRGPNPVGAFAVLTLSLLLAWAAARRFVLHSIWHKIVWASGAVASVIVLYASQSRSAWLALVAAAGALLMGILPKRTAVYSVAGLAVAGGLLVGGLFVLRDNPTISHLFFHSNPAGGSPEKSDDGHWVSLQHGVEAATKAPVGEGIGSTGSASLLSDKPVIIENQYLFMAHESGWLGLLLQLLLGGTVLVGLWRQRRDWLALGLFASGIGLALIGLLLPVWVDDTVSLYWWGLAGLAVGSSAMIEPHGQHKKRTRHQKAKRAT